MKNKQKILVHLLDGKKVIRRGKYSWRWETKGQDNPSLRNPDTSSLFRADLVTESDGQMVLTAMGAIVAADLKQGGFLEETIKIAEGKDINSAFVEEVKHLLKSGAVDPEDHHRGVLFGVALANLADNYVRGEKQTKEYKKLRRV